MNTERKLGKSIGFTIVAVLVLSMVCPTLSSTSRAQIHDIAIIDVSPSKTIVGQSYKVKINVTMQNQGNFTETFTVWTFCGFHENITLSAGTSRTVSYAFDTSKLPKGNYTLWAYVLPCFGDQDPYDNIYVDGTVQVVVPGDVDGNGIVEIKDIVYIALAYGCQLGQPCYDPNLDINCDGIIDIKDIVIAALHFGETDC